ncbi:hypothetical protein ACFYXQ_23540 [Nocardia jiangxiensis]|uniref:Uncharacterized protein n=1 Tax=Nocardia jiangxiensis TaxID=282685 RepID=A0ABW6S387_9NOCA
MVRFSVVRPSRAPRATSSAPAGSELPAQVSTTPVFERTCTVAS